MEIEGWEIKKGAAGMVIEITMRYRGIFARGRRFAGRK